MTDEKLRNPGPADWLMVRRNYQGWSYSPLTQINGGNVEEPPLAWVWAMTTAAPISPSLAHNGIIYPPEHEQHRSGA